MITTIIHATYKTSLRSTTRFFPTLASMSYAICQSKMSLVVDLRLVLLCNMNYCCDHDIHSSMSVANAGE